MGSSPSQQDYQPTEAEKASAAVAKQEWDYFKEKYDPLLVEMKEISKSADYSTTARGKANADTMQKLTSIVNLELSKKIDSAGEMSQAIQQQLGVAGEQALGAKNQMASGVLGTARGQQAESSAGMAQLSRIKTSEALARAEAKQATKMAKIGAAVQIGSTLAFQGIENMRSKGGNQMAGDGMGPPTPETKGSFWSPVDSSGKKVKGLGNRLNFSGFLG